MPDEMKEIEVICPDCWAEFTIKANESVDEIICEGCGYGFYEYESVAD